MCRIFILKNLFGDVRNADAVAHEDMERRNVELRKSWSAVMLQTEIPGGMLTTDFVLDQRGLRSWILESLRKELGSHLVDGRPVGYCSLMESDHESLQLVVSVCRWCYSTPSGRGCTSLFSSGTIKFLNPQDQPAK